MFIITPLYHTNSTTPPLSQLQISLKNCPFFFRPETLVLAKRCKIASQIIDKFKL
jgi:hypothetical protein